jgi:hypothetical protein
MHTVMVTVMHTVMVTAMVTVMVTVFTRRLTCDTCHAHSDIPCTYIVWFTV